MHVYIYLNRAPEISRYIVDNNYFTHDKSIPMQRYVSVNCKKQQYINENDQGDILFFFFFFLASLSPPLSLCLCTHVCSHGSEFLNDGAQLIPVVHQSEEHS